MRILYLSNANAENINELPNFMSDTGDVVSIYTQVLNEEVLKKFNPEFIVSDRYEFIIKKFYTDRFGKNIINLHPSLLPWNRGYHSNFWSIYENTPKGVSIHAIDPGIDTGDIVSQKEIFYHDEDTLRTTYKKLRASMVELFFFNWQNIRNGKIIYKKQSFNQGTHHFKKELGSIFQKFPKGWDTKISEITKMKDKKI